MADFIKRLQFGKQYGYETYFIGQNTQTVGKIGVILADMGMPEDYEFTFYRNYINHVFHYILPKFVQPMVLADRGICLIDPENPMAREPFQPKQLVDAHGSTTNKAGKPYVECNVTWRGPGTPKNKWDHGYFLYMEEGKGGGSDICQKTGAKVRGWYYGHLLPEKKVAWAYQCEKIYTDAVDILKQRYPEVEFRHAKYVYPENMQQAVKELLAAGCQTIVYQSFCNPIYSDFEEYAYALPCVHEATAGRARVICADQLGNQPALREAFFEMLRDQMKGLPTGSSVLLILSKHGHPFKKETQDARAPLYREPLEAGMRVILTESGREWNLVWSCDEYADEYYDKKQTKLETQAAYRKAIDEGYDYAIELPTEFLAENTDLMIFHAMKKFNAFDEYNRNNPVPYPDWEQPLVRTFRQGKTTGIYAGTPVGPYRKYVVQALVDSITQILK
jgi:hypothetical protein